MPPGQHKVLATGYTKAFTYYCAKSSMYWCECVRFHFFFGLLQCAAPRQLPGRTGSTSTTHSHTVIAGRRNVSQTFARIVWVRMSGREPIVFGALYFASYSEMAFIACRRTYAKYTMRSRCSERLSSSSTIWMVRKIVMICFGQLNRSNRMPQPAWFFSTFIWSPQTERFSSVDFLF